ncbi:hydroxymethylglutaryl-coenzyme A reductase-domain-containing protein [Aspergillus lucknowensis]|uniref:3-hydroxy-3-methylglutaryl coenzyme A reductase n=1 Tax=Aspergillus lucknowensis TaxID=176173 RepID=A0ABR4LSK9_9EURO
MPTLNPPWLGPGILSIPQKLSSIASAHPIQTVVLVSLLVSSAYVSLLENSLLDRNGNGRRADALRLYTGPDTAWRWHSDDLRGKVGDADHRAVVTLEFDRLAAVPQMTLPEQLSVEQLPQAMPSNGHSRAYALPQSQLGDFLAFVQDFRVPASADSASSTDAWVVKKQSHGNSRRSLTDVFFSELSELVHRFQIASPLDVVIMAAAYITMHLTFGSLFFSMYRLGSRFWLATSVLLSSTFAFVFALFATRKLGAPVPVTLLSEGLPFLVVTIGFENPIKLTQAVLSNARALVHDDDNDHRSGTSSTTNIIQASITQEGPAIVKSYLVEIAVLLAGALFSLDSALCQFCFLAACILSFDCVLLFSLYTAILCIKLEIIRLQGRARPDKAVRPTASHGKHVDVPVTTLLGRKITASHVRKFKFGTISAFILVNALNMTMLPLRSVTSPPRFSLSHDLENRAPMHQILGASSGLDLILNEARLNGRETVVSILPPIRFELEHLPSYRVSSLLKSLEDPILSKCIVAALAISVALNGRLFAAARSGGKDSSRSRTAATQTEREETERPSVEDNNGLSRANSTNQETQPVSPVASSRSPDECVALLKQGHAPDLTDAEITTLSLTGHLPLHALEKTVKDFTRAVKVRRSIVSRTRATSSLTHSLETSDLPYEAYDWSRVFGVCCENVVGYMPVPVGFAGPLTIDGKSYFLPMATTEGVLVAGVMRGSKAINAGGGATTVLTSDGMTRGPCVTFESLERTADAKRWVDSPAGQTVLKEAFNSTTRYGRLESVKSVMAGTNLYIRFKASTGDAMGMNMISKGVEHALHVMRDVAGFEDMDIVSLSANYCSDKKPAAINWIDGRGKSVVAQATIPAEVVRSVLKTDVESLVALNMDKNLIGSAMAGAVGGFNAHAANIVAAMYIATGQDPAQVVESANCITIMKNVRGSLQISVSMPSVEVGTIGGGTTLGPQRAMLDMLGVRGPHPENPGENARQLARIIAAATLAAELSLCAALAAGHLVKAHMQHNRAPGRCMGLAR